jgi:cytochrome d ubiquinol oxidase subunit I
VVIASNLSALWILIANSFMQHRSASGANGRAEMTDFMALITNPNVWLQWPHVSSPASSRGVLRAGHQRVALRRKTSPDFFTRSFKIGTVAAMIGAVFVIFVGHAQAAHGADSADEDGLGRSIVQHRAAGVVLAADHRRFAGQRSLRHSHSRHLGLLSCNNFTCDEGHQRPAGRYSQQFGADDYVPQLAWTYWVFESWWAPAS